MFEKGKRKEKKKGRKIKNKFVCDLFSNLFIFFKWKIIKCLWVFFFCLYFICFIPHLLNVESKKEELEERIPCIFH